MYLLLDRAKMSIEVALSRSTMLEINPIYVFDDLHHPVAVHISIGQFQQIEAILKETGLVEMVAAGIPTAEDIAWLDADLAPDLADDWYDWEEGELLAGVPVQFFSGVGIIVEG
jgi:hypothetical protein